MKKVIIAFQSLLLVSCIHSKKITTQEHNRQPASFTKLAYSSSQIMSVLQTINRKTDLMFSLVQTVTIENESVVSVNLKNERDETTTLRFTTSEEKCGLSSCPLKATPLTD